VNLRLICHAKDNFEVIQKQDSINHKPWACKFYNTLIIDEKKESSLQKVVKIFDFLPANFLFLFRRN
jgi:hypothetical protein